ncbi:unnamed protein product [Ophioblennius macclurei]
MKLVTLFGLFFCSKAVCSLTVTGYVGENATLPSGAPPAWTLRKVEWWIYSNITWIATYRNGVAKTERFQRYRGRLSFDESSGDLTIQNLNLGDAMEYSADLTSDSENTVHKINLVVKQRVQKPEVAIRHWSTDGGCIMILSCRSRDQGAKLSWDAGSGLHQENGSIETAEGLFLIIYTNRGQKPSEVTCRSRKDADEASSVITAGCDGKTAVTTVAPARSPGAAPIDSPQRDRTVLSFILGFILGVAIPLLILCRKAGLPSPAKRFKDKWCPSTASAKSGEEPLNC